MLNPPSRLSKHLREVLNRLPGWTAVGTSGGGHIIIQHPPTGARSMVSGYSSTPSRRHLMNDIRSAKQALARAEGRRP
jgi:hypothetical protein